MPVRLQNPNNVQQPDWLTDQSSADSLKSFQSNVGSYYDTAPLKSAADTWRNSSMQRFEMGADAMARAAQNRAQLSGGRVGSSFAKGGLMLGAMQQGNQMNYDYAKLAAQMMSQRAGMEGQVAGQLADYGQRRQGLLADWTQGQQGMGLQAQGMNQQARQAAAERAQRMALAQMQQQMEQARLDQQSSQFDKTFGLQQNQFNASRAQAALQALGPGRFAYNSYNDGTPMNANDARIKAMADQYGANRSALINRLIY